MTIHMPNGFFYSSSKKKTINTYHELKSKIDWTIKHLNNPVDHRR